MNNLTTCFLQVYFLYYAVGIGLTDNATSKCGCTNTILAMLFGII